MFRHLLAVPSSHIVKAYCTGWPASNFGFDSSLAHPCPFASSLSPSLVLIFPAPLPKINLVERKNCGKEKIQTCSYQGQKWFDICFGTNHPRENPRTVLEHSFRWETVKNMDIFRNVGTQKHRTRASLRRMDLHWAPEILRISWTFE